MTLYFVNLPLDQLLQVTFVREPNPPLYYLVLWGWIQFFGQGEIAVRALSALFGTLTVLPAYALGRAVGGPRAGLLAGLAVVTSPFLLWYSQEARAFALLAFLSASLLYLTHRLMRDEPDGGEGEVRRLALWAVTAALTCYTHIYGAFTAAACALLLQGRGRAPLRIRVLAILTPALAFAPWVVMTLLQSAAVRGWRAPVGPDEVVVRALATVAHQDVLTGPISGVAVLALGGTAILGLISMRRPSALLFGLAVALPLALAYALSFFKPIFAERYIIPIAVPLYVAAAAGIAALDGRLRGASVLTGLVLAGLLATSLVAFQQPRFEKENFRAAAARVMQSAGPQDVVFFVAEFTLHPFRYYYDGPSQLVGFFGDHGEPGPFLEPIVARASTIWLLESHLDRYDPDHNVRRWLEERYPLSTEGYPQGIHLRAFRVRSSLPTDSSAAAGAVLAEFGPLRLLGSDFPKVTTAREEQLHPPSQWLPVTTYWRLAEPTEKNYRVRLELVDGRGVWGGSLDRPNDLFGKIPTSRWQPGSTMVAGADLNLNPDLPPGRYILQLAVFDGDGNPVTALDPNGKAVGPLQLGEVEVRP